MTPLEYAQFVESRVKWFSDHRMNLLHAAVGMVGEAIEFMTARTPQEVKEEFGDMLFYHEHFRQAIFRANPYSESFSSGLRRDWSCEVRHSAMRDFHVGAINQALIIEAGDILDQTKKLWVYNKPADFKDLQRRYDALQEHFENLSFLLNMPLELVAKANVEKLQRRYPKGYTDAAAQARVDKNGEGA
jgi:NTP pyrophosphatase (non-canonical NTP hydrolase)